MTPPALACWHGDMTPEIASVVLTGVGMLIGVWRMFAHYVARNDAAHAELAKRIDSRHAELGGRIDAVNGRIDTVNGRIDTLLHELARQGQDALAC